MTRLRSVAMRLPVLAALTASGGAQAATYAFSFNDGAISGDLTFTVGAAALSGDPATSLPILSVTGTITDTNWGYVDVPVAALIAAAPIPAGDPLVPASFSVYPTTGKSYDNLYYADGASPVVCGDYPFAGGSLDVYGVALTLKNGAFVNVWSNGVMAPGADPVYRAYVTPEPSAWAMTILGFAGLGLAGARARKSAATA